METVKPWERWQFRFYGEDDWSDLPEPAVWREDCEYRRKPRTININGFEVPEPVRSPLIRGTTYHVPNLVNYGGKLSEDLLWDDDMLDHFSLNSGIVHLSEEAAIKHAEALLSFTRIEK